ncbi:MAG: DegT/DnrJ/EryC1/StrS family aminotransferase [Nanobdellota archaeon]
MIEKVRNKLKEITGKKFLYFTKRCNHSIKLALKSSKNKDKTKCFYQEEGGWMFYKKFAEKVGLEAIPISSKDGLINIEELREKISSDCVLLMHSLGGYYKKQPIDEIYNLCKQKNCILINDCCGSISEKDLLKGDILVCSFGRWKPINLGSGGFIALDEEIEGYDENETLEKIKDFEMLYNKILNLDEKVKILNEKSLNLIKNLKEKGFEVLNDGTLNLVVIVSFNNNKEKEMILEYCNENNLEFEECPREIRTLKKAISIEVKRNEEHI